MIPRQIIFITISIFGMLQISMASQNLDSAVISEDSLATVALEMPSLVVSGSRKLEKRAETPIAISTITNRDLEERKPNSLDQVLNQTPGVLMVDLGNEQHEMSIRQPMTTKSMFLYLEDGIPLRPTGVFNHNALIEVNMAGLDRVEIIRGPSSSLYGSEAIGGAVNFITAKPSIQPTGKISVQTNDIGYRRVDLAGSDTFGKVGAAFGGYFGQRQDGPRDHSDFDKVGMNFSAGSQLGENTRLKASVAYVNYKSDMTGSLDSAHYAKGDFSSQQTFTWRTVDAFRARLALDRDWSDSSSTQSAVFYRNGSIGQNPSYRIQKIAKDPRHANGLINDNGVTSIGAWTQHEQKFAFLSSSLIGGAYLDYSPNTLKERYIKVDRDSSTGVYTGYTDSDSMLTNYQVNLTDVAGYVQFKTSPVAHVSLVAAGRYDYFIYDYSNILDSNAFSGVPNQYNEFRQFTPKIGATYDFGKGRGLYANYALGFVPPQISELYRGAKVPMLKAADFKNYEVGGWYGLAGKLTLDADAFYIAGGNELVNVTLVDGSTEVRNAGRTGHSGVEWGIKAAPIQDITLRFTGTYAKHEFYDFVNGKNSYGGKEMDQAPNWFFNSGITLKPRFARGARFGVEWERVGAYWMDPANTERYPGYDLFNLRLGYTWKRMEAWMNVLNLAEERYATNATKATTRSYNVGEERSVNLGVAYHLDMLGLKGGTP